MPPWTLSLYLAPALAVYGLFLFWPLLQTCWLSLQRWDGYGPQVFTGLGNFGAIVSDPIFRTSLTQSLQWEIAAATSVSVAGLALALLIRIARLRVTALTLLFFPFLLPAAVGAAIWTLVYSPIAGLLNTLLRDAGLGMWASSWLGDPHLVLPALFVAWAWSALGIGTLIFWAGLRAIGRDYIDLALVEGAGVFWRFRHVLIPGLRRTTAVVVLLNAALAAQVFDLIFVTTGGGPGYATMLLPIDMYGRAFGGQAGQGAAVATIQLLIGLILAGLAIFLLCDHGGAMHDGEITDAPRSSPLLQWTSTALLVVALLIVLLPLLWLCAVALGFGDLTVGVPPPGLNPLNWGWSNFSAVWRQGMGGAILTSLLLAGSVTLATLILAPPAAFALLRASMPWRVLTGITLAIGLFQPTPVIIIPLFSLLKDLNMLDTPWGIILPEVARNLPFSILLLWAFFLQLPAEVLQAAQVDGAGSGQQLLRVTLPLARPALLAVIVWAFAGSWNEYLLPTLVSQDGSLQTVPTLLAGFIGKYDTEYGLLAAGSLLALAPSLALYLIARRPAGSGLWRLERRLG